MPVQVIHTIGHSNHSLDAFIALLKAHAIRRLVDIRRRPGSRRLPHFNQANLKKALTAAAIDYYWQGEALGGLRGATTINDDDYAALPAAAMCRFAAHMRSDAFRIGVTDLLKIAATAPTAVMCAEKDPAHCHRSLLADYLQLSGIEVRHITTAAASRSHRVHPAAAWDGPYLCYKRHGQSVLEFD